VAKGPLRKAADTAEKRMAELARHKSKLEQVLANPKLYQQDRPRALELQRELGELNKDIAAAEEAWLEASSALEAAESADD
jgi:ATP-binding cassette subfamily F protein 3